MTKSINIRLSTNAIAAITERNQRAYRHCSLQCVTCGSFGRFDELPHSCSVCNASDEFILLPDPGAWWNQNRIESGKVLIIGCGAVGNEVAKNLVLAGVKSLTLMDFDVIETSNRSRCVLFNEHTLPKGEIRYKVDAMRDGLLAIDPHIEIETINRGVCDPRSERLRKPFIRDGLYLSDADFLEIGRKHDVCVVATDGLSTVAYINRWLYPFAPLVRPAMSENGQVCEIATTIPRASGCLLCHEVGGLAMELDEAGYADWRRLFEITGEACAIAAEGLGAIAFAHTTALVGALGATQVLLLLKGFDSFRSSGLHDWPHPIPAPLWGERLRVSPARPEHLKVTFPRFDTALNGEPLCPQCKTLWYGEGALLYDEAFEDDPKLLRRFLQPDAKPKAKARIGRCS